MKFNAKMRGAMKPKQSQPMQKMPDDSTTWPPPKQSMGKKMMMRKVMKKG